MNGARRQKNIFNPSSSEPYKLSRSKVDLFIECPRCFYIDRRLGVDRPKGFPFNLNSAVDLLLKKEFDVHRRQKTPHPLMESYGLSAIPFSHPDLDKWRENFVGIQFHHKPTNFLLTGAIDEVWQDAAGELMVVDFKATSKDGDVSLDADWQDGYKRQMEFYQWLLRQNGFEVSNTGYFVYVNGRRDLEAFDGKLEFDVKLIPYTGTGEWIEGTLKDIKSCLMSDAIPTADPYCPYCSYVAGVAEVSEPFILKKKKINDVKKTNSKRTIKEDPVEFLKPTLF